jgi:Lon protease-like protein
MTHNPFGLVGFILRICFAAFDGSVPEADLSGRGESVMLSDTFDLPLFPIHSVLFPGQRLALHVFEKRYRTMVQMCLEYEVDFGVVLIQAGEEVNDAAMPCEVGTIAKISEITLFQDERMYLSTRGERRFRILRSTYDGPCLTGQVMYLDDRRESKEVLDPLVIKVRRDFTRACNMLQSMFHRTLDHLHIPRDPSRLTWVIASVLQIDLFEKHKILAMDSVGQRLSYLSAVLEREIDKMERLARTESWPGPGPFDS